MANGGGQGERKEAEERWRAERGRQIMGRVKTENSQ